MDFAGFKDPNFGRRGRKAVSSQSAMIVYGIVAAVGVVILILVFSLISKSSSITTITAENQGLNNQIDSMLQQKSKLAKDVNSVSGDRDKIKNEIFDINPTNLEVHNIIDKINIDYSNMESNEIIKYVDSILMEIYGLYYKSKFNNISKLKKERYKMRLLK